MDSQLPTPNTPAPVERPTGAKPEVSQPAATPEAPQPAATPAAGEPSGGQPPAPVLTAADVAAAIAATSTPGVTPATPAPAVAGDVDVIEPEWVEKAEEAVHNHLGDPYGEEEAIEELQVDYLQKRYGMTVADPNADPKPDDTKPKAT